MADDIDDLIERLGELDSSERQELSRRMQADWVRRVADAQRAYRERLEEEGLLHVETAAGSNRSRGTGAIRLRSPRVGGDGVERPRVVHVDVRTGACTTAHSATRTTCLPTLSPEKSPRNASGAFSRPSTTVSRWSSSPDPTHVSSCSRAASKRVA